MQPDWSNQIITIYLIGQFRPVKWYDISSLSEMISYHFTVSFLFTALWHWYPGIICNKYTYYNLPSKNCCRDWIFLLEKRKTFLKYFHNYSHHGLRCCVERNWETKYIWTTHANSALHLLPLGVKCRLLIQCSITNALASNYCSW